MYMITGARGFVGSRLMQTYPDAYAAPSLRSLSIEQLRRIIDQSGADVIIHTAAISDIPTCQADPDASYQANVLLPVRLAQACGGRKLICFSSDQVYNNCDHRGPYNESDASPLGVYAEHKFEMEQRVLDILPDAVMLRAEWMYDAISFKSNFYLNIMNSTDAFTAAKDQYRGVTYLREVAEAMPAAAALAGGVYNFGSETNMCIADLARAFLRSIGKQTEVIEGPARHDLSVDCSKARTRGVFFSDALSGLLLCAKDNGIGSQL